ncbi:MAG: SDR family NAD(P)-dependent oxidoreductase [Gammaproteobacteria bacterium]|jgi:NAD(P)-dependent dehydrogenase (short-subunit alcohol dehydrogenase family)|nr:SDR family NAD(P)-dependent oxidoreductase [Gammaproteobacteria bacterium]
MNDSRTPVWLVTGAAGALGSALVRQVMAGGADCIALDRQAGALDALHDQLQESLGRAPALMPMDLAGAGPEDYQRLAEAVEAEFGRIDVLVHNAATFQALRPLLQQEPGEWQEIIQTSLTAPWMLSAVLSPLMSAGSAIVFVADRHCLEHPGGWAAFGVAQAGRRQLARVLECDRARNGPRVIEVDPGPFYSRLRVAAWPSDSPEHLPSADSAAEGVREAVEQSLHS